MKRWVAEGHERHSLAAIAVLIGVGHSLLAMSGEESLAQVNREIASPKLKNLEKAGFVIFIYSLLFTSLVSFFAVMLIPDVGAAQVPRQPDRRPFDVPRRTSRAAGSLSTHSSFWSAC